MHTVFAPGCALAIYQPELVTKIFDFLKQRIDGLELYSACCHDDVCLPDGTVIINCCPGCNRRFPQKNDRIRTVTLWEILAESDRFPFPDYGGLEMTIHDACPTRSQPQIHTAIRTLLAKMNIALTEPEHTKENQRCCGDSAYPVRPLPEVYRRMRERAAEMPREDVCVYCVSCVKSLHIGGKTPRYLVDLLFNEPTRPGLCQTDDWHKALEAYRLARQRA